VSETVFTRLRQLLGSARVERDAAGVPRAAPESTEVMADVCRLAHDEGWKVRVEGRGTWLAPDAPADLVLTGRGLDQVVSIAPADLVTTVQAGTTLESLRRHLADHGMWFAADPPGRPDRTIGSILATATSGPLRLGFGAIRDHVLGCTFVTGDGKVVSAGGRVVKNVAGFDLTKLQVGGFGGFGILTEVHLRLRTLPRADATLLTRGSRDDLLFLSRKILEVGVAPAAMEVFSPALAADPSWVLAVRLLGPEAAVHDDQNRLPVENGISWEPLAADQSSVFWTLTGRAALAGPISLRLGALTEGLDETLDVLSHNLDEGMVSAGAGDGTVRWIGEVGVDRVRTLRRILAGREIPLTLERAPWGFRKVVGHFGAYREGVGQLVQRLRETYDPGERFSVALESHDDG
jgi:FAD/FMN-containing dehydrogenase